MPVGETPKVTVVDGAVGNIKFNAVVVGDKVTFYDTRYGHTGYGQPTTGQYYLATLMKDRASLEKHGLALDCGIPEWSVSPAGMVKFFASL